MQTGATYTALNFQYWSTDEPQSNSWFGGVGFIVRSQNYKRKERDQADPDVGLGFNFGYGREIAKHASIETNITIGGISVDSSNQIFVSPNITFHLLGY